MERLIDADALKEAMNYNGGCGICFRYIDNADTIDAIPVEWLQKKIRSEYEPDSKAALRVLRMWEKEQEAR